jgi:hypothetical protein
MLVCLCIPLGIFIVRLLLAPHEAVLVVNCLEKSVSACVLVHLILFEFNVNSFYD